MVSQTPFPASDPAPTDPVSDVDTDDLIEDVSIDGMCGVY